jgi:hypothetical protein
MDIIVCIPQQQHLDLGIPTQQHTSDRYNGSYLIRLTRLPDDGSRQEPKHVGVIRIIINQSVKLIVHFVGTFVYIVENARSKKQNSEHCVFCFRLSFFLLILQINFKFWDHSLDFAGIYRIFFFCNVQIDDGYYCSQNM